jgi:hypothetical protein
MILIPVAVTKVEMSNITTALNELLKKHDIIKTTSPKATKPEDLEEFLKEAYRIVRQLYFTMVNR